MSYDMNKPAGWQKSRKRVFKADIDNDSRTNGYEKGKDAKNEDPQSDTEPPQGKGLFTRSPPLQTEVDRIMANEKLPSKLKIPLRTALQRLGAVDKLPCKCNDKGKVKTLYLSPVRQTSKDVPVRVTRKRIVCKPKDTTRHAWDCNELEKIKQALSGKTANKRIDGGSYE